MGRRMAWKSAVLLAAFTVAATQLAAQTGQPLGPRSGALAEPFSIITTVQELPDGRVVVGDSREGILKVGNFSTGSSTQLGRAGDGPGEYRNIGQLFSGRADTLLMVDFFARRLLLISPEGTVAGTRPFSIAIGDTIPGEKRAAGGSRIVSSPRFMDSNGNLYHEVNYIDEVRRGVAPEGYVGRVNSISGDAHISSPLQMWYPEASTRWRAPLMAGDAWAVAPDGRVARVVPQDYHVEWYRDAVLLVRGEPVQYDRIPVTQTDRDAYWAERASRAPAGALVTGPPSTSNTPPPPPRTSGGGPGPITDADFPRYKPPFVEERSGDVARITPEGELWVARSRAAGDSVITIDVFNGDARLVRRLRLPPHRKVAGFGRGTVFLNRVDEDGLQWLERYPR